MTKSIVYLLLFVLSLLLTMVSSSQLLVAQTTTSLSQNQELLALYEQGLDSVIIQRYSSPVTEAESYYLASSYITKHLFSSQP
jgi:hypothetical protein